MGRFVEALRNPNPEAGCVQEQGTQDVRISGGGCKWAPEQ